MKRSKLTALLIMGNICWFLCINHYKLYTYWFILYSEDVSKYIPLLFHLHVSLILTVSESVNWKTFSPYKSLRPCRPKWKTWRKVKKQNHKNRLVMRYHPDWEQVWDYFFKVKTSVLWKTSLMYKDYYCQLRRKSDKSLAAVTPLISPIIECRCMNLFHR